MSTYITLEEAKTHLRVDFSDDDTYIQDLCNLVEEVVATEIGQLLDEFDDGLPLGLTHAMMLILAHLYMVREPVVIGVSVNKLPYSYQYLLEPYKNYTIK